MHNDFFMRKTQYDKVVEEGILPLPDILKSIDDSLEFKVKDIAALLNKSEETVRRWIRSGQLEPFSPGVYWVNGKELKRFIYAKLIRHRNW